MDGDSDEQGQFGEDLEGDVLILFFGQQVGEEVFGEVVEDGFGDIEVGQFDDCVVVLVFVDVGYVVGEQQGNQYFFGEVLEQEGGEVVGMGGQQYGYVEQVGGEGDYLVVFVVVVELVDEGCGESYCQGGGGDVLV